MSSLDVESLLQPVSLDQPCGPDLQYDADFLALETATQGKAEQQYGDTVIAAEPPDWKEVKRLGLDLLSRTKDLRIACHLARALLEIEGITAFCDCLAMIKSLIAEQWESVHPLLDPDDDNDPTERVNTVASLTAKATVVSELMAAPLVRSAILGAFSIRDVQIARGELPPRGDEPAPQMSAIEGAFQESDLDSLKETSEAVASGYDHALAIENALTEQVGASNAVSFDPLTHALRSIRDHLAEQVAARDDSASTEAASDEAAASEGEAPAAAGSPQTTAGPAATPVAVSIATLEIHTREDVVKVLDKVCKYYERYEPSSPLPMLLKRAKRLAGKSFMEILEDLSPDGVSQARMIGGADDDADTESSSGSDEPLDAHPNPFD